MARFNSTAADALTGTDTARPLASWYAEGGSDGLGDRLLMFDNSGNASLELLRFRPELAAAPGFEDALRQRADDLRHLSDPAFPQIRAVEHLEHGGLALVSTFAEGKRLGEIFRGPRPGVHPAFAAWLIRDLTASLAELQRQGAGVAHGGLTPERIVITPPGRLMIVEHALGAAIESLGLSSRQLWVNLGLVAPDNGNGTARLDSRTDVIQLAWIVLSVLVGRRLTSTEYPVRAEALVDEFVRAAEPRSPALVGSLRNWLERALQVSGDPFRSAVDAREALVDLRLHGAAPAPIAFIPRRYTLEPASPETRSAVDTPAAAGASSAAASPPAVVSPAASIAEPDPAANAKIPPMAVALFAEVRARSLAGESRPIDEAEPRRRPHWAWFVAGGLGLAAAGEAIALAIFLSRPAAAPAAVAVPITFDSVEAGDAVILDGKQMGTTPLTVTLTPEVRSVRVQPRTPAAETLVQTTPAPARERAPDAAAAAAIADADARTRRGGLQIVSPIELQVLEGDRVLGSTTDGPVVASAGRHELDFINAAIGYRSRQVVDIKAGRIAKMTVTPPDGRVSVNAAPWAQVWIDGTLAGDTPLANLPVAAGEHQITFRHPQLGEQTERVTVKSDALTRVSATFTR